MIPLVNLVTAAVTTVLAVSSGRNMLQTATLSRSSARQEQEQQQQPLPLSLPLLLPEDSTETVVSKIKSLKRKELLQLYFHSRGPQNLNEVKGEWDGLLLDNNSWVMVRTAHVLVSRRFFCSRVTVATFNMY